MAHMRLTDESYPESLTLSESKWPPSRRGLRKAVGERTCRNPSRQERRKTFRMIIARNYDYVTHEASVKPGILAIDSPLHRLWRSFPRWGQDIIEGTIF